MPASANTVLGLDLFLQFNFGTFRFAASFVDTEWFMEAVAKAFYLQDCWLIFALSDEEFMYRRLSMEQIIIRREWVDFMVDGVLRYVTLLDLLGKIWE